MRTDSRRILYLLLKGRLLIVVWTAFVGVPLATETNASLGPILLEGEEDETQLLEALTEKLQPKE
jgi:hypothetical protein